MYNDLGSTVVIHTRGSEVNTIKPLNIEYDFA